jgi:cyclophilin family peptidyl-prolyl cis-trans isomerase
MMRPQRSTRTTNNLSRSRRPAPRRPYQRPRLEALEDRSVPTAGTISGSLFVNSDGTGSLLAGEATLPGMTVELSGTTSQGASVSAMTITDANGSFSFQNVQAGNYQITTSSGVGLMDSGMSFTPTSVSLGDGQSVTDNVGFFGLTPETISLRQFLSSTTAADFPDLSGIPGSGLAVLGNPVNPFNTPFVTNPIADITRAVSTSASSTTIDLANNFSAPDIGTSEVTFNTTDGPVNLTLFDAQAPQTVANFYDYITSGAYDGSIFHRLTTVANSGIGVLQGGGATVTTSASGTTLTSIKAGPQIANESSLSNTAGTIAMAQTAGNPNSATDQFFFNLVDNSAALDPQRFTVFGRVADEASLAVLNALAATSTQDQSASSAAAANPTIDLHNIPLVNYHGTTFPTDASPSNFLSISSVPIVNRPDFLTYSVVANTNPGLVTTALSNEQLTLNFVPNQTGTAQITVRATNRLGAFVDDTFTVTITPAA